MNTNVNQYVSLLTSILLEVPTSLLVFGFCNHHAQDFRASMPPVCQRCCRLQLGAAHHPDYQSGCLLQLSAQSEVSLGVGALYGHG